MFNLILFPVGLFETFNTHVTWAMLDFTSDMKLPRPDYSREIKFIITFLGLQIVGYPHPVAVLRDYANYYLDQNVVDCGTFGRSTHFESISNL